MVKLTSFTYDLRAKLADVTDQNIDSNTFINELCDHIEQYNPIVQALVDEPNRRERLAYEMNQLERRFPNRLNRPALFGVPVGVKDNIRVHGLPTRAGSFLPEHAFEGEEAGCVSLLRREGALIIGKTATTEFAFKEPASTVNPHHSLHTPGGSSSGSAAGIAAGFFTAAIGTQTIGSVIRPAAFCGIVGFKPTFNRISTNGLIYFSRSRDHVGLFAYDIKGLEKIASVTCQGWNGLGEPSKNSLPILGIPEGAYLEQMPEEGLIQFHKNVQRLEESGYGIKRVNVLEGIHYYNRLQRELTLYEMAREHKDLLEEYRPMYRLGSIEGINRGKSLKSTIVAEALESAAYLRNELQSRMKEERIDLWICPPAFGTAPKGLHATGDPKMNLPWTFTGMPAITIPTGKDRNNLPIGLQIAAKYGQDEQLIEWAKGMESIFW